MNCKYCDSENIRKYGTYKDTQYYYCNDCERKFSNPDCIPKMQYSTELSEMFDLDLHRDQNRHLVIIASDIRHLWQGARELLDITLETSTPESEEWLTKMLRGG